MKIGDEVGDFLTNNGERSSKLFGNVGDSRRECPSGVRFKGVKGTYVSLRKFSSFVARGVAVGEKLYDFYRLFI